MDQLIEKVVIEGAEFQIIQKPATLYAGYRAERRYISTFPGWL